MLEMEFINMLERTTPQRYLRATPFSISDGVDFDGALSEEMFFTEFYMDTAKAVGAKEQILKNMKDNRDSIVVLIGYSGCGKTTFLHYLLREQKDKMYLFDFEKGIDNQLDEPILNKLRNEFNELLVSDIINNRHRVLNQFYKMYYKDSYKNNATITKQIDIDRNIQKLINAFYDDKLFEEILLKIYDFNDEQSKIAINEIVYKYLEKMDYLQLLGFLLLWDIADDVVNKENKPNQTVGAVFCFDNMDNIDRTDKAKDFLKHFAQFHVNMRDILKRLDLTKYGIQRNDLTDGYTYIISYRETTYAKLTEHLNDTSKYIYDDEDISELYVKKEIISKRNDYLIKNKDKVPQHLKESVKQIDELLQNPFVEKNVFPLFNNNYNIAVKTTCQICERHSALIKEYSNIYGSANGRFKRGANGLILRLFFDYFKSKHYFEKLQLFDFNSPTPYMFSPARLILTFLNNRNSPVDMFEIYEHFSNIIAAEDITKIIDEIYLLRFSDWRHLLTFNKFPPDGANGLQAQLDLYNEKKPISETRKYYSKLEITCAGKTYLKSMSTNFEFYASRLFGDKYSPLFSLDNIQSNQNCRHIIRTVYKSVAECIDRLHTLDQKIMSEKNYSKEDYYNSNYVFRNTQDKAAEKQFHGERIIFNHIGYINVYRQYLLTSNLKDHEKQSCNKFIAHYIIKYIELYEMNECTKSHVNQAVAVDLKEQAKKVYDNPSDFKTLIETETYRKK